MSPRARLLRLGALALFIVVLLLVAELTGLRSQLSIAHLRALTVGAGILGVGLYTGAFALGMLIHVPGMMFIAAAVAIWGRLWGGVYAWAAALVAIALSFVFARAIGGQPFEVLEHKLLNDILQRLDRQPVRTVALVRVFSAASAGATLCLALSRVRFWPMLLGSALGLVPPLLLSALFFDALLRWLAW